MKRKYLTGGIEDGEHLGEYLGCFGHFDNADRVCRDHCALRLRCVVEREQNARLEMLEDLTSIDFFDYKIH